MEGIVFALALLACPIGMGLMMWFMGKGMKGRREHEARDETPTSVEDLRNEQTRLAAEIERVEGSERARDGQLAQR